jgi:hypothetical protein
MATPAGFEPATAGLEIPLIGLIFSLKEELMARYAFRAAPRNAPPLSAIGRVSDRIGPYFGDLALTAPAYISAMDLALRLAIVAMLMVVLDYGRLEASLPVAPCIKLQF